MDWKDIGNGIAKIAPVVGGLLGGPAGTAVGGLVAEVLGTEPTPEAVHEEIRRNPDAFLKLKQMEIEKETELAHLASEDYRAEMDNILEHRKVDTADIQNARGRDTQLKLNGHHNYRADIMLALAFSSLLILIWMVWKEASDLPQNVFALFNMAIGMILKMISDGFQFEFGSSRGSKEKDLGK